MPSLLSRRSPLARPEEQRSLLEEGSDRIQSLPRFEDKLNEAGLFPLVPTKIDVFQINVGKLCNQTCHHCHVDAGPDRKEIMTRETMAQCLSALDASGARIVDITGGAPEMNPNFRWLVEEARGRGLDVIDRSNLTILVAKGKYADLVDFLAQQRVRVVASLPYFDNRVDQQRGSGIFERSLEALRRLNAAGYGRPGTGLRLDLVYNPLGPSLPAAQRELEAQFKKELESQFGIVFNALFAVTNMPISRFLEALVVTENLDGYMETLVGAFNPAAASGVMCRNTVSVGWDGYLYDCDYNQMLDLKIHDTGGSPVHVSTADWSWLAKRHIVLGQHCFGCTAGAGSSCSGAIVVKL